MASSTRALPGGVRVPAPFRQVSGPQWIILLVVLVGMALVGNEVVRRTLGSGEEAATPFQTATVTTRTIDSSVSATGTVAATRQVRVNFASTGQVRDVYVKQGDRVEAGQALATLDPFALEIKRDQARSSLATAQLRLEALLAGPTAADVATAQQSVATAQSTLTRAQNDLFNLLAGASTDDIAAAQTSLERAQANLTVAQSNWDKLVNRTDITLRPEYATLQQARATYQQALGNYVNRTAPPNPLDVSSAQATLATAQATLDSARSRLAQVLAGADPLDVASARNQVTAAEAALITAQARLREIETPTGLPLNLTALELQVESAQAAVRLAESQQLDSLEGRGGVTDRARTAAGLVDAQARLAAAQANLSAALTAASPTSSEVTAARQAVTTAETNLRNAQNNLAKLTQGPAAADVAAAQQAVTTAESQVRTAHNNLDKLLVGAAPEDVAAAKAALDNAASVLQTAQINWDRLNDGSDFGTRTEYTALMAARADYQTALTTYNLRTQGPKPGDVAAAQSLVDSANSSLNSALERLTQVLGGSLPTDIGIAREAVAAAETALEQAQHDLDNATIRAPFRATVVSAPVSPGDLVSGTTAAFTLLDPELVRIDATVDESNVIRLRQAMPVTVTFDALQGTAFQGVIAAVTPAGTAQQGVVTFPVTVVFNAQGYTIPPGTTASLRVVTVSRPNVLAVPSRAIIRQQRQTFVQVLENGKPELRPVTVGIAGDNFTEIVDGLQGGETIIISTSAQGTSSTGAFGSGGLPSFGAGAPAPPSGR
jgi:RND family efflux transporter MFP subunit